MTTICRRLHRGDDLLLSIKAICAEYHIAAGVVLSGVGCLVNTTCELVLGVLDGWRYGQEQDAETGYDEITFERA